MATSNHNAYMQKFREEQKKAGVKRISVTVTDEEYQEFAESAKLYKQMVTTHVKSLAISGLHGTSPIHPEITERLDALVSVVRGIGNNLNQLARYSNEMKYFLDTEEVRLKLRLLEESVHDFLKTPK